MAISASNMSSLVGPNMGVAGGYALGPGDAQEPAFVGQSTVTGDGANTSIAVNFIDGTNAIPFVPTGVRVSKIGGNDTNNGVPLLNTSTALNNVGISVVFSGANAAPVNGKTDVLLIELYK